MALEVIKKILADGKTPRQLEGKESGDFKLAVFTGGEPTLDIDKLVASIKYASSLGYKTRVITNRWWAKTLKLRTKHSQH